MFRHVIARVGRRALSAAAAPASATAPVQSLLKNEAVLRSIANATAAGWTPLRLAKDLEPSLKDVGTRDLVLLSYTLVNEKSNMPFAAALLETVRDRNQEFHNEASTLLWGLYQDGADGLPADKSRSLVLLEAAAASGNATAQVTLGKLLSDGRDVPQDLDRARSLYQSAADQGDMDAVYCLGVLALSDGDKFLAMDLLEKAAAADHPEAHLAMGVLLSGSQQVSGPVTDLMRSFSHYERAANLGVAQAWFNMGTCYFMGKGVPHDFAKAAECFERAAEAGFELAQVNLGHMYFQGRGVARDLDKAEYYLRMAAPKNQVARSSLEAIEKERQVGKGSDSDVD